MNQESKLRRQKIFYVDQDMVRALLCSEWIHPSSQVVRIPMNTKIPDGAEVKSCFYDPSSAAWGFVVEHESFEPVPDCHPAPAINLEFGDFLFKEVPYLRQMI